MSIKDRLRRLPRRPKRPEPSHRDLEDAVNGLFGKPLLTQEYLLDLASRLYETYHVEPASEEEAGSYFNAIVSSAQRNYGALSGASQLDSLDRVLAATTVLEWGLPVAGHVIDAAKDVIELPFKAWHVGNHYIVRPLRRSEQVEWQRALTLVALEASSLTPNIGSLVDFASIYTLMAEDKIIADAYAQVTGSRQDFAVGTYLSQFLRRPFSLPSPKTAKQ